MPALSLALVILAGPIHAVWNITAKKAGGDARFATFTGLLMALIWAPLGIWLGWDLRPTWGRAEWVFFIAGGSGLFRAAHDPAKQAGIRMGMFYGLLTGVFIASYTVVDGYAVKFVLMSPILLDYYSNFVRLLFLLPTVLRSCV